MRLGRFPASWPLVAAAIAGSKLRRACSTIPATSAMSATRPSPMIVAPVKMPTFLIEGCIGLTTISSVPRTSSTTSPKRRPADRRTRM